MVITGGIGAVFLLIDFAGSHKRGPSVVQAAGSKIASSFALSLVIYVGLFCPFYGALAYFAIENSPLPFLEWGIEWIITGPILVVLIIKMLRVRTDDAWILRRWILEDLKRAEDPRAHADSLIAKIQEAPESDSSKKALSVLRKISLQGDSIGSAVLIALDGSGLL